MIIGSPHHISFVVLGSEATVSSFPVIYFFFSFTIFRQLLMHNLSLSMRLRKHPLSPKFRLSFNLISSVY